LTAYSGQATMTTIAMIVVVAYERKHNGRTQPVTENDSTNYRVPLN